MLVLFNALQAGNRSGTGVYAAQLAKWLPEMSEHASSPERNLDFVVVWPKSVEPPQL